MTLDRGTVLGAFEVLGPLGAGGMGEVYRARDRRLGREVAIKVLPANDALDPDALALFRREAMLLASLNHPNVATVHGFERATGADGPTHFLIMELVGGETLAQRLASRALPVDEAIAVFLQIARGLESAHEHGIVHRDLKPANVKITDDGLVKILDFGIAKRAQREERADDDTLAAPGTLTEDGRVVGTVGYMSPEQLRAEKVDKRTDVWSFGCVLYEALAGRPAFAGSSSAQRVAAILTQQPDMAALADETPPSVRQLLKRCLEKDPRRRLRDVGEARIQLEALLRSSDETDDEAGLRAAPRGFGDWQPEPGEAIPGRPHWILSERLGSGGYGDVWLAEHVRTENRRVFKFCVDPERLRGLKREIALLRLLRRSLGDRPDIAQVYDWQLDTEPQFLETQYTEGGDLGSWSRVRGGIHAIPLAERLELVAQIAEALAAAHSVGVLHKDIKPANVLIGGTAEKPQVLLADFGIGLVAEGAELSAGVTVLGLGESLLSDDSPGLGSHLYIAPELLEGKPASTKSDVYSLGVVLYQMVIGDLGRALATGWRAGIEDSLLLEDIAACVDGDPERRIGDLRELASRLRGLDQRRKELAERERKHREEQALARERHMLQQRARRRRRQVLVVTVAGIVLTLMASAVAWRERQRADAEALLRAQADTAREQAEYARYVSDLQLADREIAGENLVQARDRLRAAPSRYRNWEWGMMATEAGLHQTSQILEPTDLRIGSSGSELWRGAKPAVVARLVGHEGDRRGGQMAFSADGRRLYSAIGDRTAKVWDLATGRELASLPELTTVAGVALANDERSLVFLDSAVGVLWDLESASEVTRFAGDGLDFFAGFLSPDRRYLLTSHIDGRAKVWDASTGRLLSTLRSSQGLGSATIRTSLHFTPDGRRVVLPWSRLSVGDVDLESGRLLSETRVVADEHYEVRSITEDGAWVIAAREEGGESFRIYDLKRPARYHDVGDAIALSVSGDGKIWAFASSAGELSLRAGPAGENLLREPFRIPRAATALTLNRDGSRIAYYDPGNRAIHVLGPTDHGSRPGLLSGHSDFVREARFSPDGSRLVTASYDHTAVVWDLEPSRRLRHRLDWHRGPLQAVWWSPDGNLVVTNSWDGRDALWDAVRGERRADFANGLSDRPGEPSSALNRLLVPADEPFRPDSARLALAGPEGRVTIYEVASASAVLELPNQDGYASQIAWSPSGQQLMTVGWRRSQIRVWDAESGALRQTLRSQQEIWRAEWSPDGDRIAAGANAGLLHVWDAETGAELATGRLSNNVGSVRWSADGRHILATSIDKRARLWSPHSGEVVLELCCNTGSTLDAIFHPGGERVLVLSYPRELRLFDLQGTQLLAMTPPAESYHVTFSPDGRTLAAALGSGAVKLWEALPWTEGLP